jgi:hypothetical protein
VDLFVQPVARALEGVGGERDGASLGEDLLPVERKAVRVELSEGEEESFEGAVVAAEGADDGGIGRVGGVAVVLEREGEDRVGADLEEEAMPCGESCPRRRPALARS